MTPDQQSTKALGYLRRLLRMPDGWTVEDERIHAGCEYADERTMPPMPRRNDAEALGRWSNDLASTHNTGDLCRMVFNLLAVDARLGSRPTEPTPSELLHELGNALGHDQVARPETPQTVWNEYLTEVRELLGQARTGCHTECSKRGWGHAKECALGQTVDRISPRGYR